MPSDIKIGPQPNDTVFHGLIALGTVNGQVTSTWNSKSGGQTKQVIKGNQNQVIAIALDCQSAGFEYSISGGHVWTIEITYPADVIVNSLLTDVDPITTWEFSYHPLETALFELNSRTLIKNLSQRTRNLIENKLKEPTDPKLLIEAQFVSEYVNANVVYNLRLAGVESKQSFMPTLKRSWIQNSDVNVSVSKQNNGKIWGKSALISNYGGIGLSSIPTSIQSLMPEDEGISLDTKTGINSAFGWLEYPIEVQSVSVNKVQLSQQWVYDKWSAGTWGIYDMQNGSTGIDPNTVLA